MLTIFKEFGFEAAHSLPHLPPDHKCHRVHGHSYRVRVEVTGPVDPATKFVVDYADISRAWKPIYEMLDHRFINDVPGLEVSTSEALAMWIADRLKPSLPDLSRVIVCETATAGCIYDVPKCYTPSRMPDSGWHTTGQLE